MKSLIIFLLASILILAGSQRHAFSQTQNGWFQVQTGTSTDLKSIKFINGYTGFVCSETGKIFKTTDGGFSWQLKYDDSNTPLRSLFFINNNTGWAGGGKTAYGGGGGFPSIVILKTTDNGESWFTQLSMTDFYTTVSSIKFIDENNGFGAGVMAVTDLSTFGSFLRTTNGGTNWSVYSSSMEYTFRDLHFNDNQTGYLAGNHWSDIGTDSGIVLKTTNGGFNWINIFSQNKGSFFSAAANSNNEIYFGGRSGFPPVQSIILKTDLNGSIISLDTTSIPNPIYNISFPSSSTGYIMGSSNIFKTSNSGENWSQQNITFSALNSLFFLNNNTGWIAGNNGMLFKTYTGGEVLAVDTVSPKYLPLKVGNTWVYRSTNMFNPDGIYTMKIVGEEVLNGKKYFTLNGQPPFYFSYGGINKIRVDSLNGNLYSYYQFYEGCTNSHENILDSLKSVDGDTIHYCQPSLGIGACINVDTLTFFETLTSKKDFIQNSIITCERYYAKDIGIYYGFTGHHLNDWTWYYLKGCVIDGVLYGDTTTVQTYSITGVVRNAYTNQFITNGYVKAMKYDPAGDSLITISVTNINPDGTYTLTGIPEDSVDIMAYQDDQLDFVPTYYPSTIYWEQSATLYPTGNLDNINISVYPVANFPGNSYSISGHIYKNQIELKPLKDTYIYVKNGLNFYNSGISATDGSFGISNVPGGNHNIIVNRTGYYTTVRNLNINDNIDTLRFYLDRISSVTPVSQIIPAEFKLHQNYPNPFNPKTNMRFDISKRAVVEFKIYDISGRLLFTIGKGEYNPGSYNLGIDMAEYSSGMYFVRFETGDFSQTTKIVLLK